jgi:hypothetical protein
MSADTRLYETRLNREDLSSEAKKLQTILFISIFEFGFLFVLSDHLCLGQESQAKTKDLKMWT